MGAYRLPLDFGADGWYERKLEERPLDVGAVTMIFHKWGSRRLVVPGGHLGVRLVLGARRHGAAGGKYNHSRLPALAPVGVVDRTHTIGQDESVRHWQDWKTKDLDIFGGQQ